MYTEFQVDHYKCLRDFHIGPLSNLNLVSGRKGKTTLLRALWMDPGRPGGFYIKSPHTSLASTIPGLTFDFQRLILIDDIETRMHHSTYEGLCRVLCTLATYWRTQIIATTQSHEFITEAYQLCEKRGAVLTYHRLDDEYGKVKAVTYDMETLGAALESDLEIR